MQIKLIPAAPHPTILFTITLPDPPEYLGISQAWAAQLHRLGSEELEYPQTMLALDKTSWIIACLHSVTFDVSSSGDGADLEAGEGMGRVTCVFIDGKVMEWELSAVQLEDKEAAACVEMLQSVCRDVHESALEAERERMRYQPPSPRSPTPETSGSVEGWTGQASAPEKNEPKKQGKHKKQRSLLMSLVASLVSPRSSNQVQSHAPTLPPAPTPPQSPVAVSIPVVHHSPTSSLSTALRKRARSTLVDAFRRYVLSKLTATLLPSCSTIELQPTYNSHVGYFATWITHSMLERVEAEMETLVREAGGVPSMYMNTVVRSQRDIDVGELSWQEGGNVDGEYHERSPFSPGVPTTKHGQTLVDELPPFSDDLEDGSSDETDGSSVHTPSEGMPLDGLFSPEDAIPRSSSPPRQKTSKHSTPCSNIPRSPSPPTPPNLSAPLPVPGVSVPSPTAQTSNSPSTSASSSITIAIPQPTFTDTALAAYTALSTHRLRLRNLLGRFSSQADVLATEERNLQTVLEVKARRRAWSNRDYMGKGCADMRFLGFAVPTRRSPLGRCKPINAEDVVVVSSQPGSPIQTSGYAVEGVNGLEKLKRRSSDGLVVTTAEHNIMRLFPVCEEDEDDEQDDYSSNYMFSTASQDGQLVPGTYDPNAGTPSVRLVEDSILRDAEAGLLTPLPLKRHSVPIRPRTRSMMHPTPSPLPTPPLSPTSISTSNSDSSPPSPLPTTTTFPELGDEKVEFDVLQPQTKVELFDVYSGEEEEDNEPTPGEMGFKTEFTLSMDLPPPYRMGVGMHAMSRRYDNWVVGPRTNGAQAR